MTVGETIADARGAAGLSVDEVSERTRIRETVIRSIEQDDFDALGGDLYVRGYLRAIAGVVGVDPQPLIREFDAARGAGPAGWPTIGGASGIGGASDIGGGSDIGGSDTAVGEAANAGDTPVTADAPDPVATAITEDSAGTGEGVDAAELVDAGEPTAAEEGTVATEDGAVDEAVTQPTAADDAPAAGDHTTLPDKSPVPDQPAASDEPTVTDDPAVFDEPAAPGHPAVFDQPAVFDHPVAASDFPTRVDQPAIFFDKPINEDYPTLADQPAILDERSAVNSWGSQSWNPWGPQSVGSEEYYPFWADDAVSDADPAPVAQAAFAEPTVAITAAERSTPGKRPGAGGSAVPARRPERRSRVRGWRWATVITVLVVVVLGVVGIASGQIIAKLRHTDAAPSASATVTPAVTPAAVAPTTPPAPSPTPTPTPAPKPKPAPVPIRQLTVSSAAAYGPAGLGDGDHPERASNVIASNNPAQPWQTDWYATARFGALKSGTGLLLDMGSRVTVTSLRIRLGTASGANLQIAVGNSPDLSAMSTEASTQNASGPLTLHLVNPARARYVIIWFTKLPPFAAGQYRASVYSVTVSGRP